MTTYVLGGGCFWCLDAVYRNIKGVSEVTSGYSGGANQSSYYQVASGATDHAEVIQLTFDETVIPQSVVLDIFFLMHDPTTLNRQGADVGPQYRSVLFYENDDQKVAFENAIVRAQHIWENPIVTEVSQLLQFYPAEEEHQDYFNKNPSAGYCSVVIVPKVAKVRAAYKKWFMED